MADLTSKHISSKLGTSARQVSEHTSLEPASQQAASTHSFTPTPPHSKLDSLFETLYDDYFGSNKSNHPSTTVEAAIPQTLPATVTEFSTPHPSANTEATPEVTEPPHLTSTTETLPNQTLSTNPSADSFPESTPPSFETLDQNPSSFLDSSIDHQSYQPLPQETKWTQSHPLHQIIGDPSASVQTRSASANECLFATFLSKVEPSKVDEALQDPDWIVAMQDELNQFE